MKEGKTFFFLFFFNISILKFVLNIFGRIKDTTSLKLRGNVCSIYIFSLRRPFACFLSTALNPWTLINLFGNTLVFQEEKKLISISILNVRWKKSKTSRYPCKSPRDTLYVYVLYRWTRLLCTIHYWATNTYSCVLLVFYYYYSRQRHHTAQAITTWHQQRTRTNI